MFVMTCYNDSAKHSITLGEFNKGSLSSTALYNDESLSWIELYKLKFPICKKAPLVETP